jgi:hypothetical protein
MRHSILRLVVFIFLVCSCKQDFSPGVRRTLKLAGENRQELEKVLEHYQQNKFDSLKLRAARFLIENMPGHFSYDSTNLYRYRPVIDTINSMRSRGLSLEAIKIKVNPLMGSLVAVYPLSNVYSEWEDDLSHIKSGMLISNIDLAFEYYDQNPFKDSILFEDFLEYVLPYRVQDGYCLENWRSYFTQHYSINQNTSNVHQLCDSLLYNFKGIKIGWEIANQYPYLKLDDYLKSQVTHCPQKCWFNCYLLRSFGIPVTIDFVPACRVHDSGHEWNTLKLKDGTYPFEPFWLDSMRYLKSIYSGTKVHPTLGPIQFPKVYRKTFKTDVSEILMHALKTGEKIPLFFSNPFMEDVTKEYVKTYDVKISFSKSVKDVRYAYACVMGIREWVPVGYGKAGRNSVVFRSLGTGNVYLPAYFRNGRLEPLAVPCLLNVDGSLIFLNPDTFHTRNLEIPYVAYPRSDLEEYKASFIGATIEASNDKGFKISDTLCRINEMREPGTSRMGIRTTSKYRYVRFKIPRNKIKLNELKFIDRNGNEISGKLICSHPRDHIAFERLIDGNLLTGSDFNKLADSDDGLWLGYDFERQVELSAFEFYFTFNARVRKNGIYELFYWNSDWRSLGKKVSDSTKISFENVPENALLYIKIHDTNTQSRIFTYSDGKQHWW